MTTENRYPPAHTQKRRTVAETEKKKRVKSPISYLGGKSRLAKTIVEMFPEHRTYVEPFCGAAWVFFKKEPSKGEILNDANGELTNFWRVVQHHKDELISHLQYAVASRSIFDIFKQTNPALLTDIQRAVRWYYMQRCCFGGKTKGQAFGVSPCRPSQIRADRIEKDIDQTHERIRTAHIENLDGLECIRRYDRPHTLFYIDPPYYGCESDYVVPWPRDRFAELADVLRAVKGAFILSLNDRQEVRDIFADFTIRAVKTSYSVGTEVASRGVKRSEVIIMNFKP